MIDPDRSGEVPGSSRNSPHDAVIAYAKRDGDDTVIVICSLDPDQGVETDVYLDFAWLGLTGETVQLRDELTGATFTWGERNFVRLTPANPAHILHVVAG